jgi:PEGA domain-containing protein
MSALTKSGIALAIGLTFVGPGSASAQPRRGAVIVVPQVRVFHPFYSPFWGPPWYEYGYGSYVVRPEANVRTQVTPKDAEVYVDGYYAGRADDFDGVFQRLHVVPGGHAITLHLDGYRTSTQEVYVRPDSTFKLNATMTPLGPGETSEPVAAPARPSPRRG